MKQMLKSGYIPGGTQIHGRDGVERFVDGKTTEEVELAIAAGMFGPSAREIAETWVKHQRERESSEHARAGLDLERRSVEASERAAKAAEQAADAARKSARTSRVALLVAAAAAFISAWPMIKDVGRPAEVTKSAKP